jgi:hypothetical protein
MHVEMRSRCNILVRKFQGKRLLGRPGHRWEDNIKMMLKETGFENVDRIHLTQERVRFGRLLWT